MISPNSIEQLLNAVVIEDVVGEYVSLKKSGSRYKGVCPFHNEKTPSFVVSPGLGIYKCFGCQKGGNAIQFLMDIDNLTYPESARTLAKRYGIELIETGARDDEEYREKQKLRESIQAAVDYAADFFSKQLQFTDEGRAIALEYFRERGFTLETINNWKLGYSPEPWETFVQQAMQDGYKTEYLELAGLIKRRENGTFYDLFRNRVIFPLIGVNGKVLGFAGRKMSSTDPSPKYVNSPETEFYKKSDFLFGLFQAKNAIKKLDKVYLTEGYTDVITLHQSGIENVVASSGTALTPNQIKLIRRFTKDVTVLYDGDMAGIKASLRGIDLLLQEDLNVRVVSFPEGEDPDSYCSKLGGEAFSAFLQEQEENFIIFKAGVLLKETGNDPIKKSEAVRDILESVSCISDSLKRSAMTAELAKVCSVDEALLVAELAKILRGKLLKSEQEVIREIKEVTAAAGVDLPREPLGDEHVERALLRVLVLFGDKPFNEEQSIAQFVIAELKAENMVFNDSVCQLIATELKEQDFDVWPGHPYFVQHPNEEIARWVAGVLSSGYELSKAYEEHNIQINTEEDNYLKEVSAVFLYLRRKKLDNLIQAKLDLLKNPELDASEIMEELIFLNAFKSRIASDIGGVVFNI
jgi:DNA primase